MIKKSHSTALAVLTITISLSAYFGVSLSGEDKRVFMPGPLSYAHHQIELACDSCHGAAFSGNDAIEQRCRQCHKDELQTMEDAHGAKKFGDPRNAKWLQALDAKRCLSCHQEHVPDQTQAMSVSQPKDFCLACHADVGLDRPSHLAIDGKSCSNAGCHNYHDNRVLHEDVIAAHLNENDVDLKAQRPARVKTIKPMLAPDRRAENSADILAQWSASSHAQGHANCSDCHRENTTSWSVDIAVCKDCHEQPFTQWSQSHHGMKSANTARALHVADSALPMQQDAESREMNCHSCHQTHRYDTVKAEAESCLACHADQHSLAWPQSAHAKLWQENPERGASCAGCHMPRIAEQSAKQSSVLHNSSTMMRPADKMLRSVCMNCHGYSFALRALSDATLIDNNFSSKPPPTHDSLDWVRARQLLKTATKTE